MPQYSTCPGTCNDRPCRAAVSEEYERNKSLGEAIGCWKSKMLVEDDAQSVKKALEAILQPKGMDLERN